MPNYRKLVLAELATQIQTRPLDLASCLGSLARLAWLVIPAFCLDVQQVRMWERGCFPTTILAQPRRPCRPRHPYAVPRTSLPCVCTRRRNCIEQLSPSPEYAPPTVRFPARNPATFKLTHPLTAARTTCTTGEPATSLRSVAAHQLLFKSESDQLPRRAAFRSRNGPSGCV